jgi:putative aminopeptidase FrvX
MSMFDLIKTLTEMDGPVGQEGQVLDYVESLWRDAGASTRRSRIGNVIAEIGERGPRILLIAHADELCYLVRSIHPDGFLWLAGGQAWMRTLPNRAAFTLGQRVRVLARSGPIPGVIGTVTGHVATLTAPELHELTWNDFWVDTGLTADELAERGVTPGTRVVWDAQTVQLGPHVMGKALDDRVLLAVQTEVLRRVPVAEMDCRLTLVASVQEEIGLIGAFAIGARNEYDAALVLEIGLAGDIPTVTQQALPLRLGAGPILVHKDSLVHYDHKLTTALERIAADAGIGIQHAVFGSFGSDGSALIKADIPSALLAFPARYTHSPYETAHLQDIDKLAQWVEAFVRQASAWVGA